MLLSSSRLADLLVAGVVMNQVLQPHEAHIPFVLQFMIDHHLFGMNHIHLASIKFRMAGSHGESTAPTTVKIAESAFSYARGYCDLQIVLHHLICQIGISTAAFSF